MKNKSCCFRTQKRDHLPNNLSSELPVGARPSEFTSDRQMGNFFPLHKGDFIVWLSGRSSIDALRCGADEDHPGNPAAATVSGSPPPGWLKSQPLITKARETR